MKIETFQCDKCHRSSNGDIGDWMVVRKKHNENIIEAFRLSGTSYVGSHACGESCALSLVAELLRALPK